MEREGGLRAGPVEPQQGSGDRTAKEQRKGTVNKERARSGAQSQGKVYHRAGEQLKVWI